MTDARLPERLLMDVRVSRLSADAWRSYTYSLMWAVSNRTEGYLQPDDLTLIPLFRAGDEDHLVKAGVWQAWGRGWHIVDFDLTQTTKAQLEAAEKKRFHDRQRQAALRLRKQSGGDGSPDDDQPPDHGVTRDVGCDNKGQASARTGYGEEVLGAPTSKRDEATSAKPRALSSVPSPQRPSTAPPLAATGTHGGPSWDLADEMYERS